MRRYVLQALALFFAATLWMGCDKKDHNDTNNQTEDTFKLSGTASGANERPVVITDATGTIAGTYHTENKMLDYTITWTNLSAVPTMMHFHGPVASPDSSAGVQVPITGFAATTSGTISGMATLSADQESQLLSGKWYYNIHTGNHPGGEIRGNITATHD